MRKTLDILRRKLTAGMTNREVADACQVSPSTVCDVMGRFAVSELSWPLPEDMPDAEVELRLYSDRAPAAVEDADKPDFEQVHHELRTHKHLTLQQLWREYKRSHPEGYAYSWYCECYAAFQKGLEPVMRQTHVFGQKCFVDYAGDTVPVVDPETGEVRPAQVFVGVLGASNYTYAEATWTQDSPTWLRSHVRMLNYFGGCPEILVPDNLKSGVTLADRYEPQVHPAYANLARHYGMVVIPARSHRPKDKAKAEGGVKVAEMWILAALRKRTFFRLDDLNDAIGEHLVALNDRPFQKLSGNRREWFVQRELPALRALPAEPYCLSEWRQARVRTDYHVEVERHYYSVSHTLLNELVEVWLSAAMVELCHQNRRVASHVRSFVEGGHTTLPEHMPPGHRSMTEWTPERLRGWAAEKGTDTVRVVDSIMAHRHPEQAQKACLGVLRLAKKYGNDALEAACRRAVALRTCSYQSVKSILEHSLQRQPLPGELPVRPRRHHENVRGPQYYQTELEEESTEC